MPFHKKRCSDVLCDIINGLPESDHLFKTTILNGDVTEISRILDESDELTPDKKHAVVYKLMIFVWEGMSILQLGVFFESTATILNQRLVKDSLKPLLSALIDERPYFNKPPLLGEHIRLLMRTLILRDLNRDYESNMNFYFDATWAPLWLAIKDNLVGTHYQIRTMCHVQIFLLLITRFTSGVSKHLIDDVLFKYATRLGYRYFERTHT